MQNEICKDTIRMNRNHNLRMAAQHKHLVRMERLEKKAEPMIGELSREGRTVYYVFPAGGRYFESQNETECVDYLIRNKYVR